MHFLGDDSPGTFILESSQLAGSVSYSFSGGSAEV